ncbi:MAG: hypothetical protein WCG04_06255 [Alphaproteobacteria bacterium]
MSVKRLNIIQKTGAILLAGMIMSSSAIMAASDDEMSDSNEGQRGLYGAVGFANESNEEELDDIGQIEMRSRVEAREARTGVKVTQQQIDARKAFRIAKWREIELNNWHPTTSQICLISMQIWDYENGWIATVNG